MEPQDINVENTGLFDGTIIPNPEANATTGNESEDDSDDIISIHMDLIKPLSHLRTLTENIVGMKLTDYAFWLQDSQELSPEKNLVDQCVQGEGLVQINVQIHENDKKINIVDVLKPTDDVLATYESENSNSGETRSTKENKKKSPKKAKTTDDNKRCVKWIVDLNYKKEMQRLGIPEDPIKWNNSHVQYWLLWAINQFNLTGSVNANDWNMNGEEICKLSLQEFKKKVSNDPGERFWTHIELLRKCKFVAIVQTKDDPIKRTSTGESGESALKKPKIMRMTANSTNHDRSNISSGHIQLWQFLLELLTDKQNKHIIEWQGVEGEFKLTNPEMVAQLWGERKNKPAMNYEKLSRALRYYYDGDLIAKVSGKRFVYKFVVDLKQLIGYNAEELAQLVSEPNYWEGET